MAKIQQYLDNINSLSDIKVNTDKINALEAKIEEILQILKTP